MRWGARMGDAKMIDMMVGALTDPFDAGHMGITAENIAAKCGITRERAGRVRGRKPSPRRGGDRRRPLQDADRADRSQDAERATVVFDTDEHVRADTTVEELAKLQPAFKKDGTVTAGNASGINDGAAAVVLMETRRRAARAQADGAARRPTRHAGVDPKIMGIGPVPAAQAALEKAGLHARRHGRDRDQRGVRRAGAGRGARARLRHGEGQSERRRDRAGPPDRRDGRDPDVKALYELQRTGGRYALVTMCIGGGQGIAAMFERL